MVNLDQLLQSYILKHCLDILMQNNDEAEHQSGWSWSVYENVITLEPHGIFSLNLVVFSYERFSLFLWNPFSRLFIDFEVIFGISNKVK